MVNIVVGIDGSAHADTALGWARELARSAPEYVLHLVHSYHVPLPGSEVYASQYNQLLERAEKEGQELLDRTAAALEGIAVRTHLLPDAPAPALLAVARQVDADLIALGSRGLSRTARIFLGSVSHAVIHHSDVPVLVVRGDDHAHPIGRVLVGVDGSDHSARALAFAVRWAPAAEVIALHVMQLSPEAREKFAAADMSVDSAAEQTAAEIVERTVARAGVPVGRVKPRGTIGNAAEELLADYRWGRYDLAVVGSRGLGTLAELLLGSVSERMARLAEGPVVIVK